jgi:hypothetical protein
MVEEVGMPPRGQTYGVSPAGARWLEADDPVDSRATIARWPLDVEADFARMALRDPWASIVRESMVAYREGRTDVAGWGWTSDIVWRIKTNGFATELRGAEEIFDYHRRVALLTGDTFRQRVVALQAGQGPIVEAFLRSTGRRGSRELDIPTLVVFELSGSRIHAVTEMPGDPAAWRDFWSG